MAFWIFMVIVDLIVPAVMAFLGWRFLKKPPEKINDTHGYRTTRSMKSQETWAFAHGYCGMLWFVLGLILLPLSVIPMVFVLGEPVNTTAIWGTVVCTVQLVILVATVLPVERALKRYFDENGHRRQSR